MLHQSLLPRITASTFINRTKTTANAVAVRKLVSKEEKRKEKKTQSTLIQTRYQTMRKVTVGTCTAYSPCSLQT